MNEKIRQLAEQATRNVESGNSYHSMVFDKEKFAELIVRECAAIAERPHEYIKTQSGQQILKHFGVEE